MDIKNELKKAKNELKNITDKINQLNEIKKQLTASGNKLLGKIEILTEMLKEESDNVSDDNGQRESETDDK